MNKNDISYSLSGDDIGSFFINPKIIKYSELKDLNSIDDILDDNTFVIILIETKLNNGHWVALIKQDMILEQFDSYSGLIDSELKYVNHNKQKLLGADHHYLTELIQKSKFKTVYNKVKLQAEDENTDTCGKWVVLRLLLFLDKGYNIDQFLDWFLKLAKKMKLSNDELVCKFILF